MVRRTWCAPIPHYTALTQHSHSTDRETSGMLGEVGLNANGVRILNAEHRNGTAQNSARNLIGQLRLRALALRGTGGNKREGR